MAPLLPLKVLPIDPFSTYHPLGRDSISEPSVLSNVSDRTTLPDDRVGASFVPLMVMVTSCVTVPPF